MGVYAKGLSVLVVLATVEGCVDVSTLQREKIVTDHIIHIINNGDEQVINDVSRAFGPDSVKSMPEICPGGVKGLITATKHFPNAYIVNLNVPDFYKFNYNYVSQHLIYGGDRSMSEHEVEACVVDFKNTNVDIINITCNEKLSKKFSYHTVKLMSKHVGTNQKLHKYINNYPHTDQPKMKLHEPTMTILICDENLALRRHYHIHDAKFNIKYSKDCEHDVMKNQDNLIAVFAPQPFDTDITILAPIILYKTSCYDERITKTDHVMLTICDDYKYLLLKFLKHSNWLKVAIVSDNTAYSEKFEREMTALLKENNFAYAAKRCVETTKKQTCSFSQGLKSLIESEAKIFIANVGKTNAQTIEEEIRHWNHLWTERIKKSTWIFLEDSNINVLTPYKYYITPAANTKSRQHNFIKAMAKQEIKHIYQKKDEQTREQRKDMYRKLTKQLQKQTLTAGDKAYQVVDEVQKILVKLTINNNEVKAEQMLNYNPQPDMDTCVIRKSNFQDSCDDSNLLGIIFILVIVAACGLIAVIVTTRLDSRRRYTNL